MKKYLVYVEDYKDVYRIAVPANNEKEAKKFVEGNGEIIKIKDVTNEFPISIDKVVTALEKAHFGKIEVDLIMRTLMKTNIAE